MADMIARGMIQNKANRTIIDFKDAGGKIGTTDGSVNSALLATLLKSDSSIFFPSGVWCFNQSFPTIPARCKIYGEGRATTLKYVGTTTEDFLIRFLGSTNSSIKEVLIDCQQKCSGVIADGAANDHSAQYLNIEGIKIFRAGKYGMRINSGGGGHYRNIEISSTIAGNMSYELSGDYGLVINSHDGIFSDIQVYCFRKVGIVINYGFNKMTNIKSYVNHVGAQIGGWFEDTFYSAVRGLDLKNFESQENHSYGIVMTNVWSSDFDLQCEAAGCVWKTDYPELTESPQLETYSNLGWDENGKPISLLKLTNIHGCQIKFTYDVDDAYANRYPCERYVLNIDEKSHGNIIDCSSFRERTSKSKYPELVNIENPFANRISFNGVEYNEDMLVNRDKTFYKNLAASFTVGSNTTINVINDNAFRCSKPVPTSVPIIAGLDIIQHHGKDIAFSLVVDDAQCRFGIVHATKIHLTFKDSSNVLYQRWITIPNTVVSYDKDENKHVTGVIKHSLIAGDGSYGTYTSAGYTLESMLLEHTIELINYNGIETVVSFTIKNIKLYTKYNRLKNLLGLNGNFVSDYNANGLGDGLNSPTGLTGYVMTNNTQYMQATGAGAHYVQFFDFSSNHLNIIEKGDILYGCILAKTTKGQIGVGLYNKKDDSNYEQTTIALGTKNAANFEFISKSLTVSSTFTTPNMFMRIFIYDELDHQSYTANGENCTLARCLIINKTKLFGKGNEWSDIQLTNMLKYILLIDAKYIDGNGDII